MTLLQASRNHISQLLHYVSHSWEKYVMTKYTPEEDEGRKATVNALISIQVRHMQEHCEEIREIRRVHGL